ncbi:hypothetical protein U9M48_043534 [Paspalum notatum var. saurae]|uniref:Uncharacterized protein n=1 Tax=Paspalum notatum var. saurae TaxID=547442 RepID=A0AAQ3XHG6_PASNO
MHNDTIHLGHPLHLSYRNRTTAYNFLINKSRSKHTGLKIFWIKSQLLSGPFGGKATGMKAPQNLFALGPGTTSVNQSI